MKQEFKCGDVVYLKENTGINEDSCRMLVVYTWRGQSSKQVCKCFWYDEFGRPQTYNFDAEFLMLDE